MPYKNKQQHNQYYKIKMRERRDRTIGAEIQKTIERFISNSRSSDKYHKRMDVNNFIDKDFCKLLIENSKNKCCYCEIDLEIIKYGPNLISIERIDNSIGHIKSNVKICCLECNSKKIRTTLNSDKTNIPVIPAISVIPAVSQIIIPESISVIPDAYIYHSIRRFELYYDMLQMREELKKQTYFNKWMNKQLNVLDEIKHIEYANIEYKKNKLVNDTKPNIQFNITSIPFDESKIENIII